jgi:hypothetical protein
MLIRVTCPCGHIGIVSAATLPRELRCWQCGSSRHVEVANGWRMASGAAVLEWLCGAEAPRAQTR